MIMFDLSDDCTMPVKKDWRLNRDKVERLIYRYNKAITCCGLLGMAAACLQHEAVLVGESPNVSLVSQVFSHLKRCSI
jgi:hypothetical protein